MSASWSSRSLGSRFQHQIFYSLIQYTGVLGGYILLAFVISWYTLCPSVRRRSRAYLTRRFPGCGPLGLFFHTWRLHWTFGRCLVDRAAAGLLGGFSFEAWGTEVFDARRAEGRGLILLTAHTGCWQMSPYTLAEHAAQSSQNAHTDGPNPQVTVLAYRDREDIDKQAHEHQGGEPPYEVVTASGQDALTAPLTLLQRLRRGGIVCVMGDRVLPGMDKAGQSVAVRLFGDTVRLPLAPYRLASASGAPVICTFSLRSGSKQGRLLLADVLRLPKGLGNDPEAYRPYAQRFAAALETFCKEHPHQFFTFYDPWEQ